MDAVRRHAVATFSRPHGNLDENLRRLVAAMSLLTREDVGLDVKLMRDIREAPVTYVSIQEHEDVTISMFVLRHRSRLPLHDHPLMYGIIKVVSGIIEIKNYSFIQDPTESLRLSEVLVKKEPPRIISENDPPIVLTPTKGNIHEITCPHSAGAAFVDVLAPPYGSFVPSLGPRSCFYYFESDEQPANPETARFVKSLEHPEFWTDVAPYCGQ
uniref:2-aminoethanethiol dioxygenase n=3 Tax=Lygus hesperus TaxID=30085 RepID=A0A0A9YZG5_LYGHE